MSYEIICTSKSKVGRTRRHSGITTLNLEFSIFTVDLELVLLWLCLNIILGFHSKKIGEFLNYLYIKVFVTMLGSGDGSYIIKLRGLPFSTTAEDVLTFLSGVNVINDKEGKFKFIYYKKIFRQAD